MQFLRLNKGFWIGLLLGLINVFILRVTNFSIDNFILVLYIGSGAGIPLLILAFLTENSASSILHEILFISLIILLLTVFGYFIHRWSHHYEKRRNKILFIILCIVLYASLNFGAFIFALYNFTWF